jgi:uncharacterized damage-inducible protein DinB
MTTATSPMAVPVPSIREQYLEVYNREAATTLKLLEAYPADQSELRPHERAKTARELAFMFALEQGAAIAALNDTLRFPSAFPPTPDSMAEVIEAFRAGVGQLRSALEAAADTQLLGEVTVPVGKGAMAPVPKIQFCWLMLMDQVHHRGQFSVYLRMTGARVPSIYGPSADEPWA